MKGESLAVIYRQYLDIGRQFDLPLILSTPTWRASRERISEAGFEDKDINGDNFRFLDQLRNQCGTYGKKVAVGGLLSCRGDAFNPDEALSASEARKFHAWQAEKLAEAGVDFLLAATLPALSEAIGLSAALSDTGITLDMTPIPGGRFVMGSAADEPGRSRGEGPTFEVQLDPFWIGKCEVTWRQYDLWAAGIEQAHIVTATGSGGTQTGLTLGAALHRLPATVWGVNVCDDETYFLNKVASDVADWRRRYPDTPAVEIEPRVLDGYVGQGYAVAAPSIFELIAELTRLEGLVLDPVYTGKAFAGMLAEIADGRFEGCRDIVFVHTGGIFGLFPQRGGFIGMPAAGTAVNNN